VSAHQLRDGTSCGQRRARRWETFGLERVDVRLLSRRSERML
jgi:hypothetical protein